MEKQAQKIINLLALADGNANINESKVARQLAEKLMAKYKIFVFKKNGTYAWKPEKSEASAPIADVRSAGSPPYKQEQCKASPQYDVKFERMKCDLDKKVEELFREPKQQHQFVRPLKAQYEFPWSYIIPAMIVYHALTCFIGWA